MTSAVRSIERRHEPASGALAMQVAVLAFALQDAGVKWLLQFYPLSELLALRSGIVLVFAGVFLGLRGQLRAVCRIDHPLPVFGRGFLIVGAFLSYFTALAYMPLADVMAIFFAVPILQSVLSGPLLGEAVGWRHYLAILVGFIGVLIMVGPTGAVYGWPTIAAVFAAIFYASAMVWSRALGSRVTPTQLTVTTNLVFFVVGGAIAPFVWRLPAPTAGGLLAVLAALSFAGHLGVAAAYRLTHVAVVAPLEYTAMPVAVVLGFWIWGDWPTWGTIAGLPFVIGSGVFIIWRENRSLQNARRA